MSDVNARLTSVDDSHVAWQGRLLPLVVVLLWVLAALPLVARAQSCDPARIRTLLERHLMPDLKHCPREWAVGALEGANHPVTVEEGTSNDVPPGTVYQHSPESEMQLEPSTPVTIWVSIGPVPEDTFTDVAVRAGEGGETDVPAGEKIGFEFIVENRGTATIPRAVVRSESGNLDDIGAGGDCHSLPCELWDLAPGVTKLVLVIGVTHGPGDYSLRLDVSALNDVDPSNNVAEFRGMVTGVDAPPPPPISAPTTSTGPDAPPGTPGGEAVLPQTYDLLASVDSIDERWIKGRPLRFRIKLWNRGSQEIRDVVVALRKSSNLGPVSWPDSCQTSRCTIASVPPGETYMLEGEFETPRRGEVGAEFSVDWGSGRNMRHSNARLAGEVGTQFPWIWFIAAACAIVFAYRWLAPRPLPIAATDGISPAGPHVPPGSEPEPDRATWEPRVRVDPVASPTGDASLLDDPPLTAPPLRVEVTIAFGDAMLDGDLPVRKKES